MSITTQKCDSIENVMIAIGALCCFLKICLPGLGAIHSGFMHLGLAQ
uniref:Uncharacterized protein n=1 Tax=Rhizophora mucronata TaxID=61149 RepID=A0A2P2QZ34_RHIMU